MGWLKVRSTRLALGGLLVAALAGCAITDQPSSITETGATLNGRVHPRSMQTTWWFEYGTTTSYGSETPREEISGDSQLPVSKRVTGLAPGTTYHYRACDMGQDGHGTCGLDKVFDTVRFSPDGRVFVAEKSGLVKVFDGLDDSTPAIFADLRDETYNFWDRGLLGLALDPSFPAKPFVYVAYSYDASIGGTAPLWGQSGDASDTCPTPPGPITGGCLGSGRVSRLTADGDRAVGPEQVLVEDFCQQFPTHSMGSLAFGPDGSLFAAAGDAAHPFNVDYGEFGAPGNPCGDPPGEAGDDLEPPTAEGGALRSQDLRTSGDPAGLTGSVIRVDPETGEGMAGNPGADAIDRNVRRIVGYGLRNPFRMAVRPGTGELWIGDVGWGAFEEIDRLTVPADASADDFGWPCYEGAGHQPGYDDTDLDICESLYASGAAQPPFHAYRHSDHVVSGETCTVGSSAVTGIAFGGAGPYPDSLDGALFFADQPRNCIWAMKRDGGSLPSPSSVSTFVQGAASPVDVQIAPSGELFYVDFNGGTIHRLVYSAGNRPPVAVATADRTAGGEPLTVTFDGSTSDDPDSAAALSFAWDLDGDGAFDDSTSERPAFTYDVAGTYSAELKVTDAGGATATDTVTISAGNTPPVATIAAPSPGLKWKVDDPLTFEGAAVDEQDVTLPPSALSWTLVLHHCPSDCHPHTIQSWTGEAGGTLMAPDHEYPSYLELRLTATDSGGLQDTQTVRLDPRTVEVAMQSEPPGLSLSFDGVSAVAPFTRTVIEGSANLIGAASPQASEGNTQAFQTWSDGGSRAHTIVADDDSTFTATFGSP
ncbi:MAG: hypothetical protein QOD71_1909 [Thermoleophilaceae bacterium]|nr:hypothetical protein [Thermoleophilaceae bacterium]